MAKNGKSLSGKDNGGYSHGMTGSKEYVRWHLMRQRCANKNTPCWKNYGGRGITVCDRWNKFENFYADMGPLPSPEHTLERIDNNKGYSKSNCKWATKDEQNRNKQNTKLFIFNGEKLILNDIAKKYNISISTLRSRIGKLGYSIDDAVNWPKNRKPLTKARSILGGG